MVPILQQKGPEHYNFQKIAGPFKICDYKDSMEVLSAKLVAKKN